MRRFLPSVGQEGRDVPVTEREITHRVVRPQRGMAPMGARWKARSMQVPPDLASRLSSAALMCGCSPETLLREGISRLLDGADPSSVLMARTLLPPGGRDGSPQQSGFVPQPQSFSVYE